MTFPEPRPRDAIVDRLRQLHELRAAKRTELVCALTTLDALDQRIDAALAELADTIRTPAARRPGDDAHLARGGGEGVRA